MSATTPGKISFLTPLAKPKKHSFAAVEEKPSERTSSRLFGPISSPAQEAARVRDRINSLFMQQKEFKTRRNLQSIGKQKLSVEQFCEVSQETSGTQQARVTLQLNAQPLSKVKSVPKLREEPRNYEYFKPIFQNEHELRGCLGTI